MALTATPEEQKILDGVQNGSGNVASGSLTATPEEQSILDSVRPKPQAKGVVIPSLLRGAGTAAQAYANTSELVGIGARGLAEWGKKTVAENPSITQPTVAGLLESPGTAIVERTLEQAINIGTSIAGAVAGAAVGGPVGAAAGVSPKLAGAIGAYVGGAASVAPSTIGEVGLQQEAQGIKDPTRQVIAGLGNAAIEAGLGVQATAGKIITGLAEKSAAEVAKETVGKYAAARAAAAAAGETVVKDVTPTVMKSIAGFAKKSLSIAAAEALEEVPQNEISRWAAHQDVLTKQSLQEDMDNAASAFAGSLLFGGVAGGVQQTTENKAVNAELAKLKKQDEFNALPAGTQKTIEGTNPQQQEDYVAWAADNTDAVGDKRVSRYGVSGVVQPKATFEEVNDAIKLLETGAPVTALKVMPQVKEVDAEIAKTNAKIADAVGKVQAQVDAQQVRTDRAVARAAAQPDNPKLAANATVEAAKLGRVQQKLETAAPEALTKTLVDLNKKKETLAAKVQPLVLEGATAQTKAQDTQRQKTLEKLHQLRGDMAYFQDLKYQKELENQPAARDTLTRDLFDEADAREKSQARAAEFEQAQAQADQVKQEQLDALQANAPARTFTAEAPATVEPTTALGQALTEAGLPTPVPEATAPAPEAPVAALAPNTPLGQAFSQLEAERNAPATPVVQPAAPVVPEAVPPAPTTNASKLEAVYKETGKTAKEAAALVRAMTKNVDVEDAQAVSDMLVAKAENSRTQTSFDTLNKLHQAVTGKTLDEVAPAQVPAPVAPQAKQVEKASSLGDKFTVKKDMALGDVKTVVENTLARQQALTGKTVQQVADYIAKDTKDASYAVLARKLEKRLTELEKEGTKFSFNIVTPETLGTSPIPATAVALNRFSYGDRLAGESSQNSVWVNGVGVPRSSLSDLAILHELTHGATYSAIELGAVSKKGTKERQAYEDLRALFDAVGKEVNKRNNAAYRDGTQADLPDVLRSWAEGTNNAFQNLHELTAWASTDKDMQAFMDTVKYRGNQTLWERFVDIIRKFIGLEVKNITALEEIMRVTDELLGTDTAALNAVAQEYGISLLQDSALIEGFNDRGFLTADTEVGRKVDSIVSGYPTLASNVREFMTAGVAGTTSSAAGKAKRALEKNFQSPLHLASKSKGFSQTWDRVRQIPANAGYILNKAFAPLENSWVKGMDITTARALQFATGIENTTFQDLRRAENFLQEWNVSGQTREEFLNDPATVAKYGDSAQGQRWFERVNEARQAIDFVLDAQFMQNAEDMRSVIADEAEFDDWLINAKATNEQRKDTGYIPIRRYGDYSVAMYDTSQRTTTGFPKGDVGLMGKWFFTSEVEAREFIRDAKEMYKDEPNVVLDSDFTNNRPQYIPKAKASQYSYSSVSFRQFLELAKRANVPISAAEQQRLAKLMINADSMYQNRIQQRKNIPGGSKDLVRSMSEFITHIANKVASDRMAPRISEAMNISRPLSNEEVNELALLHNEFDWVGGKSEQQIREAIHENVEASGGTLSDEISQLARFNKMRELESNGFLAWQTSVDVNNPNEVAEYYDLLERNNALEGAEAQRFNQLSTPDPQSGFYHDKIAQHVEFLNNPKDESFANLRRFAAINFLGGSIASMMVNLSSLPLNFMPYMHQYGGTSAYTTTMHWFTKALRDPLLRNTIFNNNTEALEKALSPEGKLPEGVSREQAEALLRAFREEVVSDTQVFEYFAAAKHGVQIGTVLGQRAQALWMSPFRVSEMLNRVASFMAAYDIGSKNPIDGKMLGAEERYQFARKAVDQTQFIYGPINRMGIAQNPIGFALMTFRAFPIMTIELLSRLPAKQRTIMLGTMLLASGVGGIPFKEDIADVLDTIGEKLFGVPLNTNRVLHNFFKYASEAMTGTDLSRLIMTGPLDTITGASIGSRVSPSNIIPATRIGVSGYSMADAMLDLSGVIGAELKGLATGAGQLVQGNTSEAALAAAPTALKGIMRFTEGVNQNRITDKNGNTIADDLTMAELGWLGAGFTLSRSNWQNAKNYSASQEAAYAKETTATMFNQLATAIQKGDYEEVQNAFEAIQQWNEENPEFPYKINPNTLRRELITRNLPSGQREMMKIKQAWRGSYAEDLLNEE